MVGAKARLLGNSCGISEKNQGISEDYAIIKYFTLKEMGVDPKSMRIVVLRDTIRNLAHAVLVVYSGWRRSRA